MSNRVEFAGGDERVDTVLRRLINGIRNERGFERITVVTPTNQASFYLRRALAKNGLFNVDFKRLEDIAELLAGREFYQPLLHDLQASEFVFDAARDITLGEQLGGEVVSPQLQAALHSTFRELELLDPAARKKVTAQSTVQRELVARFDRYLELASEYRRGAQVAETAAKIILSGDNPNVAALGTVLLVEASVVAPPQRPLFGALAAIPNAVTISIVDSGKDPTAATANQSSNSANRIKPIGVPDVAEEVRCVVREIIAQTRQGKRFARMAVVFEDDSYATRIAEALELANIPVSGPDRTALIDAPEGQFINGLLNIFENDFGRIDVTQWLSSAPVKDPKDNRVVPASRWDAISRTAGVTSSVENSWTPRLDRYARNVASRAENSSRLDEGRANEAEAAKTDAEYAVWLKEFIAELKSRAPVDEQDSWSGFAKWLRSMVGSYLVFDQDATDSRNSRVDRMFSLIDRLESLQNTGEQPPAFAHCVGVLREQLGRRSAGLRSLGVGVYVGPVWTAAGCPFDTVFVLGMSEGRYPSPGLTDPLLPDPMKREIDPGGALLTTVERRVEQSKQSFVSVIESAETVFMYWPVGIPGESREFGPARWFLEAVRKVSGQPLVQAGQLSNRNIPGLTIRSRSYAMAMSPDEAGDPGEYDVAGARMWARDNGEVELFPLTIDVPVMASSVKFEQHQEGPHWTEYDGKVALAGTTDDSTTAAGTTATVGSATAFETYAACPYRYFLSRRLHIEPTESPEPEMALDALAFGTLIHDVLEKFGRWRIRLGADLPKRPEQEAKLRTETRLSLDELKEKTPGRSEGAWNIEFSRAWLILRQWFRGEPITANQPEMRQVEAEFSFGRDNPKSGDGPAVEVRTPSGDVAKFRGQVDRVDISADNKRIIVYDYKSGGTTGYEKLDADPVKKGTKLQLPLYSKAVAHEYPDAEISAAYWFVREPGNKQLQPSPDLYDASQAESALTAAVEVIVEGIDAGVYPARPGNPSGWGASSELFENCQFCEYARVCPKSKSRLWHLKKNSDPALENYLSLAEDRS